MKWAQLEPGVLVTERRLIDLGGVVAGYRRHGAALKGDGTVKAGYALFGMIDGPAATRWDGLEMTGDDVATTRGRIDLSSDGPQAFYTLSLRCGQVCERYPAASVVCESLRSVPEAPSLVRSPYVRHLRAYVRNVARGDVWPDRQWKETIGGNVLWLLAAAVGERGATVQPSAPLIRRIAAVRVCQDYIQTHVGEPVGLLELSQVSGLRPRSLINAFEAVTGMSPMAYLRARRLNGVRTTLRSRRNRKIRIIDVAADWGFWHMGHFAAAYRAMFGEKPSDTLMRARAPA